MRFYLRRTFCTVVDPALCVLRKKIFFRFLHLGLEFGSSDVDWSEVSADGVIADGVVTGFSGGVVEGGVLMVVVEVRVFCSLMWFDPG